MQRSVAASAILHMFETDLLHKSHTNKNHPVARRVIFILSQIYFLKGRRVNHFWVTDIWKRNFIKIMLAVIIFMMLVYRESLKESCLSYEKLVNEFEKICNFLEKWAVFGD